jgi:Cytochrome P450
MSLSYRKGLRGLLLAHYFPYLRHVFYPRPTIVFSPNENVLSLGSQLQKENIAHPQLLAYPPFFLPLAEITSHFITNYTTYALTNALNQGLVGLLTNYPIGRRAQGELDKLIRSPRISLEESKGLVVLPAVVQESIRRSLVVAPMDTIYQVSEDAWHKNYFLPKGSLLIIDRDEIFPPGSRLSDEEVFPHLSVGLTRSFVRKGSLRRRGTPRKLMRLRLRMGYPLKCWRRRFYWMCWGRY